MTLHRLESWQLSGQIGVQTAHRSGSAWIHWVENNRQYTITLLGPLGTPHLTLRGQPGSVTLTTADGHYDRATTPEQLLAQQSDWRLPLSSLFFWIRGLPSPHTPYEAQYDPFHRLRLLRQQNWLIHYPHDVHSPSDLPEKIILRSPTMTIKIIIYHWDTDH
jgi:outer membrane lipoprotein LolB